MSLFQHFSVDAEMMHVLVGVLAALTLATLVGQMLKLTLKNPSAAGTIENLNMRVGAWWWMTGLLGLALLSGQLGSLLLFGLLSLLALREYITLVPTQRGDHRALFWSFFLVTPVQYYLIGIHWYGLFAILIPVWVFLLRDGAFPRTRRQGAMGANDLRLLPEPRSGFADAAPCGDEASALPSNCGPDERCAAVLLGKAGGTA
jgi:hypothetical protein